MVMDAFGYVPNAVQSASALLGIQIVFIWLPAVIFLLGIVPMLFYSKYEKKEEKILLELARE